MLVVLYLQPDAFDLFWTAAEATHGSTRNMEFVLKPDSPGTLTVTNIGLFESMPGSSLHPVVAELRVMREKAKSIVVGFSVVLIAWILLTIYRTFDVSPWASWNARKIGTRIGTALYDTKQWQTVNRRRKALETLN